MDYDQYSQLNLPRATRSYYNTFISIEKGAKSPLIHLLVGLVILMMPYSSAVGHVNHAKMGGTLRCGKFAT